ncbi:MAG: hypothetical protein IJV04_04815, partial [Lachnospiraceae bacterium]|nr:hypothetical protein [Lachnospiraceae bacterium]
MPQPAMEDPLVAETVKESQAPTETAGGVPISPERRPEERIPAASRYTDGIREISLDTLRREQDVVREEIPEAPQSILPDPTGIYIPRSDPDEPLGSYRNEYDEIRDVFDEEPIYASAHKEKPAASAVEVMSEKPVASTVEALSEAPDIRESLSGESAFEAEETLEEEPSKHVMPEEVVDSFIPEIVPMNRTEETKDAAIEEGSAEVLSEEEVSAAAGGLLFKEDASRIPETVTEEPEPAEAAQYSMEAATPTEEPYLSEAAESTEERYPMEAAEAERFSEETERESAVSGFSLELSAGSEQPSEADRISMEPISEMAREAEEEVFPAKPEYHLPPVELLSEPVKSEGTSQAELVETSERLRTTLANFGVNVTITDAVCGPTVTRYELQPEKGVKVSKIVNLSDDIKLNLAAADIRIEAPIPGKPAIGIEVPNSKPSVVSFRELMESDEFQRAASPITFAAGRDIGGKIMISDIAKMPHVLIAGATGAGKSVWINTIIMSILYKAMPDEVKFIMIDPKVVELSVYNGIPHLLIPVVTDPKKAAGALAWAVKEMMDRYDKFAKTGVRDMKGYNARIMNGVIHYDMNGQSVEAAAEKMPQIVVIVDELADLMMVASHEVEESICRLAQLARAAGIHLVIATQRPSVNVITGLIKANMPSRIAFAVTSGVDSRTILDMVGAEKLLGKGDMLYYPQGLPKPLRVQGAFVSDKDVARVVDFIRKETGPVEYSQDIDIQMQEAQEQESSPAAAPTPDRQDEKDVYFDEAVRILTGKKKASISMLQRYLKIGFNRAARIMDQLGDAGVVGPEEGTKPRKVLMTMEEF